ncbi:hypothetical protein FD754_025103 [Muntiacus muntjak]|uniref:Uncharacterized protein n=1 Tax=Muntiacus muntjak TaxID=9888 RepID=A0A5N3ULY9_MUNMU|nr:hypothetical protein FD754_025103 [Muntiacus muntjak]
MVDTGAQHSVLNKKLGPMSKKTSLVQGATGTKRYCWTTERKINLGTHQVSHSFLVIPECPAPLLGRDLLTKVNAQIHFDPGGMSVTDPPTDRLGQPIHVLSLALRDEYRLFVPKPSENIALDVQPWVHKYPLAWAETAGMGLAKQRHPVVIELKAEAVPVRVKQYPMSQEARRGITPHIRRLMDAGILRRCQSPWNTPLLPVKKPGGTDYRPVQDLRKVNKRVSDIYPTVPNPYTLLSSLLPEYTWYTVLDLKDAFFSLPLAAQSQEIFAFEWTEGEGQPVVQLTWTRLPQGFKNSPTLFNEALSEDLCEYRACHPEVILLQYVDDLMLAGTTEEACSRATGDLLQTLGILGYRASAKKAQIARQEVTYLGYKIRQGQRWLTQAMKETILQIPEPKTPRQVREFLGTVGYCRLWIMGFTEKARPLYEGSKETPNWTWTEPMKNAFQTLRQALLEAPALALPNPNKPFQLFVDKKQGIGKGRPVAYLSKRLDPVAAGWPPCLRIIAATALLVRDADKLTYGQQLLVYTPHAIEGVLKQPPGKWISNARLTHYQALLLDAPRVRFQTPCFLNPATLLPNPEKDRPLHDCNEILAEALAARKDLTDVPLSNSELIWFTDESSYVKDGQRKAGAAIVDDSGQTIWAETLPPNTSAQKAELIALIQALEQAKGKRVTIYTDSRYAFSTAHIQGPIYQEKRFRTAEGKEVKNLPEIRRLLEAVQLPRAVAIVHVPGHQKGEDLEARGNRAADAAAREAASRDYAAPILAVGLPPPGMGTLPPVPDYSLPDLAWINKDATLQKDDQDGWYRDQNNNLILPATLGRHLDEIKNHRLGFWACPGYVKNN